MDSFRKDVHQVILVTHRTPVSIFLYPTAVIGIAKEEFLLRECPNYFRGAPRQTVARSLEVNGLLSSIGEHQSTALFWKYYCNLDEFCPR